MHPFDNSSLLKLTYFSNSLLIIKYETLTKKIVIHSIKEWFGSHIKELQIVDIQ